MKKQILTLIIGILIGAIITTAVFLIIKKNDRPTMPQFDRTNINYRDRSQRNSDNQNRGETNEEIKEDENN